MNTHHASYSRNKLALTVLTILVLHSIVFGQAYLNDIQRSSLIAGNKVSAIMFNYGSVGQPNNSPGFEWPSGSDHFYGFEFGLIVGASVIDTNGDRLHIVNDGLWVGGVTGNCENPVLGFNSGWEPLPGFAVSDSGGPIACSNDQGTWPENWSSWPGYYADGEVLADLEIFYAMDDRYNCRYSDQYLPDPENTETSGAGLRVGVRGFQWSEYPYEDVLLVTYEIRNTSLFPMDSIIIGVQGDPVIGGVSDYNDDMVGFIDSSGKDHYSNEEHPGVKNLIYYWDADNVGDPSLQGRDPGYFGIHILDSDFDIKTCYAPNYSNSGHTDDYYWDLFTSDDWTSQSFEQNADNLTLFSLGIESLDAGESILIPTAYLFGETKEELINNTQSFEIHYQDLFNSEVEPTTISVQSPILDDIVSSDLQINWSINPGSYSIDSVGIYLTDNRDVGWRRIAVLCSDLTSYSYEIGDLISGINYQVAVRTMGTNIIYSETSDYFSIQTANTTEWEFLLLTPVHDLVIYDVIPLFYRAAGTSSTNVSMLVSINGGDDWGVYESNLPLGSQEFTFDTRRIANSNFVRIAFSVSEPPTDDTIYLSNQFQVWNDYMGVEENEIEHISGLADGHVSIDIVDVAQISGDEYEITFEDSFTFDLRYSVRNLDTGDLLIDSEPVLPNHNQGSEFEGIRLAFQNVEHEIIDSLSGWSSHITNFTISIAEAPPRRPYPYDYELIFYDFVVDTTVLYSRPTNCIATNTTTGEVVDLIMVGPCSGIGAPLDNCSLHLVHDYPEGSNGNWASDWSVHFSEPDSSDIVAPGGGDTLMIQTIKPFTFRDTLIFSMADYVSIKHQKVLPERYFLSQNYPNPFNPITTIQYRLHEQSDVTLIIYDISGREVKVLVNQYLQPGNYRASWDGFNQAGKQVATGLYFARFQARDYSSVIKIVYLQ